MEDDAAALTEHLRTAVDADVRSVARYEADDIRETYRREDLVDAFPEEEVEAVLKNLVLKSLDDATHQPEFTQFGHLDATVRWFEHVVAVQVPLGEWDGVVATYDRDSVDTRRAFTGALLDFVDEELHAAEADPDVVADAIDADADADT